MTEEPTLLELIRSKGLAMKGLGWGKHIGWTTDEDLVRELIEIENVTVKNGYNATGPRGWEISIPC
jgi:hypothetical protein